MSEKEQILQPLNKNFKEPKLRFPEFKDEWIKIKLCDIATRLRQKNKDNYPYLPLTISAQEGLISQFDYYDKQIASLNLSTYYIIQKGQFAYNKSYSNGYPYGAIKRLNNYDIGVLSSLYICFQLKRTNSDYICFYFDSNKWNKEVRLISGEGARNHGLLNLSADVFFNISFFIPNYLEQEKISKFLLLLYKKIELLESKISILKKYKKGLIKKLLNKYISNEFLRLSDVCKIDTGKLDANQMVSNGKYKFFTCSREDFCIDSYAFDCEAILISGNGDVGFSKYYKGKFNAYQRTYVLHDFLINAKFIKIIFDENVGKIIRKETNIGAMPYIRKSTFEKVLIPKIKKESIEYFVSIYDSIEYKINLIEKKLNLIRCLRNQLLKDMFI